MPNILIGGIVSQRDRKPYVQIDIDGRINQLSVKAARQIAEDIIIAASRAEADAMIFEFFRKNEAPADAAAHLMQEFRSFRSELDSEQLERSEGLWPEHPEEPEQ